MSKRRLRARIVRKLRGVVRRHRGPLAAVLLLFLVACVSEEVQQPHPLDQPPPELVGEPVIRVQVVENQKQVKIACAGPCRIVPSAGEPLFPDKVDELVVTADEASLGLKVGDKPFLAAKEVRFAPSPGAPVKVEGKPYRGDVVVKIDKGVFVKAINYVRAEDYVAGVLPGEVSLKWPDAAIKAQAIAARTYAIWHWKRSQAQDHDVTADTRSQMYVGQAPERSYQLVAATQGKVLTYKGQMFEAFFYAACAGETASADWIFGGPSIPPLSGAKCGFCVGNPHAAWERKLTQAELAKSLASFGVKGRIERLETVPWPRAGYVKEVRVHSEGGDTVIPATKFRFAFQPGLKSTSFEVATDPSGEVLILRGKGWGHGVGLCQWGAKGAAEAGMDEEQILFRYYPSAGIQKLY